MRQTGFVILLLWLLSCNGRSTESSKNDNVAKVAPIESETRFTYPEDFNEFLNRFNSDSAFQLSRIKFPMEVNIKDPHEGNDASLFYEDEEDWIMYVNLEYKADYHDNAELEFKQDTIWNQSEVQIQQRGGYLVTQINWDRDYTFSIIDGKWFLVTMKDFSNSQN